LALIEGCKHEIELTIPAADVAGETDKVTEKIRGRAHLKGFRPGKAPASLIRSQFGSDIRQEVLEAVIPKFLKAACERENLVPVSQPSVKDLHYHEGEELHCKVEFEVEPEIVLKEVRGLAVEYSEPVVTDADVDARIEEIRQSRAEYVNIDPRPAQDGDHALVSMESVAGVEGPPIRQDEINIEIGHADTFVAFSEALRGAEPGDEREAEIEYPENYAEPKLAGRKVRFRLTLTSLRRKELPELNDEFAKDLGDFQSLDELRDEIRKRTYGEREYVAQTKAKNDLVDKLVEMHEFPVPDVYVDQQLQTNVENQLRNLASQGVDVSKLKLDWAKLRESQRDRAVKDVKASLLLDKLANIESIHVTQDEVDQQVQQVARQEREPVAAVRKRLQEDGTLRRIAGRIRTEKTLSFLFEHATKTAAESAQPA